MEVVATEGAAPYKAAIDQYLPQAQHVPDRFHVIRWFRTSLIQLRRAPRAVPRPGNPACTAPAKTVSPPPNGNGSGNRLASPTATTPNLPGPQLGNLLPALDRFTDLCQTGLISQYRKTRYRHPPLVQRNPRLHLHTIGRRTNGPIEAANNFLQKLKRTAHSPSNPQNYAHRGILLT